MKAYEFLKYEPIISGDGNNHTGLDIMKRMTGKMQCLTIHQDDDDGNYFFRRVASKTKTRVMDYTSDDVQRVMALTGKGVGDMITMYSLSTSVTRNQHCQEHRLVSGSICEDCFACTSIECGKVSDRKLSSNYEILTGSYLNWNDIPVITSDFFRFESFGDIDNIFQVINYILFCEKALVAGSKTRFGLWTKNPDILAGVFNALGIEKPENLQIQVSSLYKNTIAEKPEKYWFIDRIFTVWNDVETANAAGVTLNCCNGIRKHTYCIGCTNCYVKGNGVELVNELLRKK